MRHVQNCQLVHALRRKQNCCPRDCRSPIVSSEMEVVATQSASDVDNIGNKVADGVVHDVRRFAAEVVSTLVGSDDAKARFCQGADLLAPRVPELGKAVQQDHQQTVCRTRSNSMQANAVALNPEVFEWGQVRYGDHSTRLSEQRTSPSSPGENGAGQALGKLLFVDFEGTMRIGNSAQAETNAAIARARFLGIARYIDPASQVQGVDRKPRSLDGNRWRTAPRDLRSQSKLPKSR